MTIQANNMAGFSGSVGDCDPDDFPTDLLTQCHGLSVQYPQFDLQLTSSCSFLNIIVSPCSHVDSVEFFVVTGVETVSLGRK